MPKVFFFNNIFLSAPLVPVSGLMRWDVTLKQCNKNYRSQYEKQFPKLNQCALNVAEKSFKRNWERWKQRTAVRGKNALTAALKLTFIA